MYFFQDSGLKCDKEHFFQHSVVLASNVNVKNIFHFNVIKNVLKSVKKCRHLA